MRSAYDRFLAAGLLAAVAVIAAIASKEIGFMESFTTDPDPTYR